MFDDYPLRFMFAFGIAVSAALGFGVAWYRASRRLAELEDRLVRALSPSRSQEPVADAIDSLSARMDDIANGQDFLNRVLSERLSRIPANRPAKELTPV